MINSLKQIDENIREVEMGGGFLTNTALHLRSCHCVLLSLHFEGLLFMDWRKTANHITEIVNSCGLSWNVLYLNTFPGTEIISKITFRKLCSHCLENYKMDKQLGMNTVVYSERFED